MSIIYNILNKIFKYFQYFLQKYSILEYFSLNILIFFNSEKKFMFMDKWNGNVQTQWLWNSQYQYLQLLAWLKNVSIRTCIYVHFPYVHVCCLSRSLHIYIYIYIYVRIFTYAVDYLRMKHTYT